MSDPVPLTPAAPVPPPDLVAQVETLCNGGSAAVAALAQRHEAATHAVDRAITELQGVRVSLVATLEPAMVSAGTFSAIRHLVLGDRPSGLNKRPALCVFLLLLGGFQGYAAKPVPEPPTSPVRERTMNPVMAALVAHGDAVALTGDHRHAALIYQRAITEYGPDAGLYVKQADAQHHVGDYVGALGTCERALKVNANYGPAYSMRGLTYMAQAKVANAADRVALVARARADFKAAKSKGDKCADLYLNEVK